MSTWSSKVWGRGNRTKGLGCKGVSKGKREIKEGSTATSLGDCVADGITNY